jgi:hypothetical protein
VGDTDDVLDIEIGLSIVTGSWVLNVECAIDEHLGPVLECYSIDLLVVKQVVKDGRFIQEATKAHSAAALDAGGVVSNIVHLLQASRCDSGRAGSGNGLSRARRRSDSGWSALALVVHNGTRRRRLAKVGGWRDEVNVGLDVAWDGVRQSTQFGGTAIRVVVEVCA